MTTRLCLVRHGETDWNAARRIQGQIDIDLNETGCAQARATARGLAGEGFAAVYASDLKRARATAEAIAAGQPVQLEPALRERHYGAFQGLTYAEARARLPQDYARFEARDPDFAFGHGEPLRGFAARVEQCLRRLVARHPGESLLLVTHGGVLDIVYRLATGMALTAARDFLIPNAALNRVAWCGRTFALETWGDRDHLACALDELPG